MCAQQVFNLDPDGSWQATLTPVEGSDHFDIVVDRPDQRFFEIGMNRDGFPRPVIFQKSNGEKIGDIVIELRLDPEDGRYKVRVEGERHYLDPLAGIYKTNLRTKRASVSNVEPVPVDDEVLKTGEMNLDSQRLAGDPVFAHFVVKEWDPELAAEMIPLAEYMTHPDGPGRAALMSALVVIDDADLAHELLDQARAR